MASDASLAFEGDTFCIDGVIDFSNVIDLRDQGDEWLRKQAPQRCRLDLSKVSRCNSAAATLLLSLLRTAKSVNKNLVIEHIPQALHALLDLGGVKELLFTE